MGDVDEDLLECNMCPQEADQECRRCGLQFCYEHISEQCALTCEECWEMHHPEEQPQ